MAIPVVRDGNLIEIGHRQALHVLATIDEALALARDLRDAADPWSMERCIEWMRHRSDVEVAYASNCRELRCHKLDPDAYQLGDGWAPDGAARHMVHDLAVRCGEPCPLGDLCPICHPPAPPVPTDEELARMGTEWLIRWIEGTGHKVLYSTTDDPGSCPWSACRYQPHSHLKADTLLGLAKAVAAQLREANEDA